MKERRERARILIEALPFIQKYDGKTIVVKYGGSAMMDDELKYLVMQDIVLLTQIGMRVVVVHGGGPEISSTLKALGKESVFVEGLRYTDAETADVVSMVLAGKVNKSLVSLVHKSKGKAIGLCGVDGAMLRVKKMEGADLGYVGDIVSVDVAAIDILLDEGFIPIIATVGVDDEGQVYNINADTAAAEIASSLEAEKFILLTDVRGVLNDPSDEETLIPELRIDDIPKYESEGIISGGMIPKIASCTDAIKNGLKEAVIIDGRIENSILLELLSIEGIGTLIKK